LSCDGVSKFPCDILGLVGVEVFIRVRSNNSKDRLIKNRYRNNIFEEQKRTIN
jgi:hypothetical protein